MDLSHAHHVAVTAAGKAGALLRQGINQQKNISRKSSAVDLLTEYDQAAETLISDHLHGAFPDHSLVAEESAGSGSNGDPVSPYTWYIDPLDGTNNFAHGFPVFAVSIALYQADQPLVGVVYDPMRDECFSAIKGLGASLQSAEGQGPIQVSEESALLDSLLATGFPYDRHNTLEDNVIQLAAFLKSARGVRRAGAAALDLAYVAAGRLDGFWELKLSSWDVAAGVILVQEAGGRVTGVDGKPLRISPRLSLVASNGPIHQQMISTLGSANGRANA